jgi:crotonobetaine/carnitine-CoA ligase
VAPGDRIAALCLNRIELLELILGCGSLGGVAVPLNTASRGPQLSHMLADAEAKAILVENEFLAALDTLEEAAAAQEYLARREHVGKVALVNP